jgi:hypothetical protein
MPRLKPWPTVHRNSGTFGMKPFYEHCMIGTAEAVAYRSSRRLYRSG